MKSLFPLTRLFFNIYYQSRLLSGYAKEILMIAACRDLATCQHLSLFELLTCCSPKHNFWLLLAILTAHCCENCKNNILYRKKERDWLSFKIQRIYEPRHEKTCLCHMRTTKAQICLFIRAV